MEGGTKCKIGPLCGLAKRNLQFPEILGLSSESKISWFNFLVDLKEQSTLCEKNHPVWILKKEICNRNSVKFGMN
jgi:hypothetical protein